MSTGLSGIISTLESLAGYEGPWRPLRGETTLLRTRLDELREREQRLDDVLLVALVGGSGVGKSTLLNALAGDQIAETSEMRPCTSLPTVYHPPGMRLTLSNLSGVRHVARSALDQIALIDTPDSDTIVREHRRIVEQVLQECDLILLCADSEKYLDEATWSLLYPVRGLRAMVCVETRVARPDNAIREHWLKNLRENGFQIEQYFRVNALRAFDRKLALSDAHEEEFDFPALERFLRHELDRERVTRIKSSNAAGLLAQTVNRLHDRMGEEQARLDALQTALTEGDEQLIRATLQHFTAGPLAEPYLWVQALGREVSLRATGGIGTLYKIVEVIRSLPHRIPAWLTVQGRQSEGAAARTLFDSSGGNGGEYGLPEGLMNQYGRLQSEMRLRFIRAGFDLPDVSHAGEFQEELSRRVRDVFRGAIHEGLAARARGLCAWPVAFLLDSLPVALVLYTAYLILRAYFTGNLLSSASFLNTGFILLLLVAAEVALLSAAVRLFAWSARKQGLRLMKKALARPGLAFHHEKSLLAEANALVATVREVKENVSGAGVSVLQ